MARNTSDILVDSIIKWGVDTIFGIPGDGINGVMEALRERQQDIRFIQCRHEEGAAFMACGYAKYTGKLGCCLATSGPGAVHLLNGLYDAKCDQAPVLAITGQTYSDLQGSFFQQDLNTIALFQDVAVFNQELINPIQAEMLANEACRAALNHRGVAHISVPIDYQTEPTNGKPSSHNTKHHTNNEWSRPIVIPASADLQKAAAILNEAKRPVLMVGQGALGAKMEVAEIADLLGSPVVKALLGKAVLPDDHPLCTGGLGLLGTTPSQVAMEHCDAVLFIGTSFPYMEYLPKHDQARGVQIDDKGDRIALRYPVEAGLVGDAKHTLKALIPLIERKNDRQFLEKIQEGTKKWWDLMDVRAREENPIKPQQIAKVLSELASDDAILSTDSGTSTSWAARHFKMTGDRMFSCSGTLATMAPGLPYAIAAKIAYPHRQSIAFVGDGGFTMLMGEFATAVKYDLPIVVVIVKNNTLGQIKWEQIVFLGNPEYGCELQPIDFAKVAEACGGLGFSVDRPEDVRPTLERALASGRPCVVQVAVDPFEPPMPAKISLEQVEGFAKALARGEPNRGRIATTLFRDKLSELI